MKNRLIAILIFGVCFNVNISNAQIKTAVHTNIDSLENYLNRIDQNYNELAEAIDNFDKMAKHKKLSNQNYVIISKYILENEIRNGYNFILDNALMFNVKEYMKPIHLMAGESPIIYKVLKSISIYKIQLLIHHILYSDYLSRELSNDQLDMLSAIIRMDGLTQVYKVKQDSTRVLNLNNMIKYINNEK